VYVMQRGRLVISGTVDEVRDRIDEIEATYLSNRAAGADAATTEHQESGS